MQWVYEADGVSELARRYDKWAETYNGDIVNESSWTGHIHIAEAAARFIAPDGRILDAGCGTGLAGTELSKRGFTHLDGFDLSEGMLSQASALKVYGELKVAALGEPLDYPNASYDAAIACGVFSVGHASASGIDEVIRIVKPGGVFILTLRADIYASDGYQARDEQYTAEEKWQLAELSEPMAMLPEEVPKFYHCVRTYRILR